MRNTIFVLLCLVFCLPAYAGGYKVREFNDGFELELQNLDAKKIELASYDSVKIMVLNELNRSIRDNPEDPFEHLEFRFASVAGDGCIISISGAEYSPTDYTLSDIGRPAGGAISDTGKEQPGSVRYVGLNGGIPIWVASIKPYYISPGGRIFLLKNARITVKHAGEPGCIYKGREMLRVPGDICNPVQYRIISGRMSPKLPAVQAATWYDKSRKYVKLSTTRDGVAEINFSSLVGLMPEIDGKESKFLHMIHRGQEVPIYISDNDQYIDKNAKGIFRGHRTSTDSTWLDFFTAEYPYYIYYDESTPGQRIEKLEESTSAHSIVQSVKINRHFQKNNEYWWGKEHLEITKSLGEDWYWKKIVPVHYLYDPTHFNFNNVVEPWEGGSLTTKVTFTGIVDSLPVPNTFIQVPAYYIVKYILNGDTVGRTEFERIDTRSLSHVTNSDEIIPGANRSTICYLEYHSTRDGILGINSVECSGDVVPAAYMGRSDFYVPELPADSKLSVKGFTNSNVAAIDTVSGKLLLPRSIRGTTYRAGAKNSTLPYASVMLNDSLIFTESGGYVAAYTAPNQGSAIMLKSSQSADETAAFLDAAPSGSVIVLAANLRDKVSGMLTNTLAQLGATSASNLQAGMNYAFSCIKGNAGSKSENSSATTSAKLSGFYPDDNGAGSMAEFNLPAGRAYYLYMNDNGTIERPEIYPVNRTDLRDTLNRADAIYVTHKLFRPAVERLAAFREKTQQMKIAVVDADDIYKEFNDGYKSPHAIKEFFKYAYFSWATPRFGTACLVGDASYDYRNESELSVSHDYMPTFTFPTTDFWFSMLDDDYFDVIGEFSIGRIPAQSLQMAEDYVDKAIRYDTIPARPWMKNILFLTGGTGNDKALGNL